MNKEQILSKSREENQGKDLYAIEVLKNAPYIDVLVGMGITAILFLVELFICNNTNYGLWSIVTGINASSFIQRGIKLKEKSSVLIGIIWAVITIALITVSITMLINSSILGNK